MDLKQFAKETLFTLTGGALGDKNRKEAFENNASSSGERYDIPFPDPSRKAAIGPDISCTVKAPSQISYSAHTDALGKHTMADVVGYEGESFLIVHDNSHVTNFGTHSSRELGESLKQQGVIRCEDTEGKAVAAALTPAQIDKVAARQVDR